MPAGASDRLAPPCAGGSVLVDGPERKGALTPRLREIVVVILRAARLRLKPLASQAKAAGEFVKLVGRVRLQVPAAGPSSPVAQREGAIHIDAQVWAASLRVNARPWRRRTIRPALTRTSPVTEQYSGR